MTMLSPLHLAVAAVALLAMAVLMIATLLLTRERGRARSHRALDRALDRGPGTPAQADAASRDDDDDAIDGKDGKDGKGGKTARALPLHWLRTRWGRVLVADEDRRLIDQCGWPSEKAQLRFLVARLVLAALLPLVGWVLIQTGTLPPKPALVCAIAFVLGFLAPKWVLGRAATAARARVDHELPLFVDLLRLLQGVGLSLDQSLHIMASDFDKPLRLLGRELVRANRQYSQGRTREQSLRRLAQVHGNEHLAGLVALLVQVDRHGGAVQQPLQLYSDRLREHRRNELKARIGKITVKMTGVMVTTLLPALVIATAGPGFLAVVRSLGALAR